MVKPHKKKRWRFLCREHPDLFRRAIDVGLIEPEEDWDESLGASPFDEESLFLQTQMDWSS